MKNHNQRKARCSAGLTVVEVLFAMLIILVGLTGVAFIIPFAGRKVEDSYRITQALAAGESALGVFNSSSIVQPRMNAPWQIIDDRFNANDSIRTVATSWGDIYRNYEYPIRLNALGVSPPFDDTKRGIIALAQNQALGTGFCIDPLFWGYQERGIPIMQGAAGNYRRTRFPFYDETMPGNLEPLGSGSPFSTPRLRRVTLADPLGSNASGNGGWLRLASAIQLATISGGDVLQAQPEADKSAAPLRGEYVDGSGALLQSPTSGSSVSWIATLTPSDSTPIVTPQSLTYIRPNLAPTIEFFPENYDLAVVVFSRRDVREQLDPSNGIIPSSERLGLFSAIAGDTEYLTSGTFDFEIASGLTVDPKVKIGSWLMLSRYIYPDPYSQGTNATNQILGAIRERHKWYRVISVSGDNVFPRHVRVAGLPWDWTEFEVAAIARQRRANPLLGFPTVPTTAVTLLKDVVQVYQRNITLQPF